ncbi:Lipopolysaccharide biosynthesis protein, LPS:glycosyltransferase [Prevotella sp. tc2-28]|uniref:glycosyltransferase family 8 protein n=1 Tax=Prevotella sp. tc2-28 TaxID=1761888 RepID=UPI00089A9AF9|nr:glycosyltransferase family 8 protein [Prevotella sp. tc2-28]SEA51778.1 Lipopolysaccharide biosynthesis protein, LPS:glycosyltransferase [Prevotella sp. tc2-28]
MFRDDTLHVVLATDDNYAEFVSVVIVSILHNNKQFESIHIHLLANGVCPENIEKLRRHLPTDKGVLHVYDISDLQQRLGIEVPNTIALSAYARLFMADILPYNLERVLYLDCDVVVSGNIQDFWTVPLGNNLIAGVRDTLPNSSAKNDVGLANDAEYLNSGVLLINLKLWREEKTRQKFVDFLYAHNGHVHHHDQGIINAVCNGRKYVVHPCYNLTSNFLSHPFQMLVKTNNPFYTAREVNEAKANPAIIHFTQGFYNRPWIANSNHPFKEVYLNFHRQTRWAEEPLRSDNRSFVVRILSWEFLNLPLWVYNTTQKIMSFILKIKKWHLK